MIGVRAVLYLRGRELNHSLITRICREILAISQSLLGSALLTSRIWLSVHQSGERQPCKYISSS